MATGSVWVDRLLLMRQVKKGVDCVTVDDYISRNGVSFFSGEGFEDEAKDLRNRTSRKCYKGTRWIPTADLYGRATGQIPDRGKDD